MGLRDLIGFLTSIPVGESSIDDAARTLYLAPLVGLIEGLGGLGVVILLEGVDANILAAILLVYHIFITGGLHLDGFADYSEVLLARARGVDAVRILKDPRRGSFSIISTVTLLLLRYSVLGHILSRPWILVLSYIVGAESLYIYIASSPRGGGGRGGLFRSHSRVWWMVLANTVIYSLLYIIILFYSGMYGSVWIMFSILTPVVSMMVSLDSSSRIGRPSGDAAGFSYELTHTLYLLLGVVS